jgi:hypothetical protein
MQCPVLVQLGCRPLGLSPVSLQTVFLGSGL